MLLTRGDSVIVATIAGSLAVNPAREASRIGHCAAGRGARMLAVA